MKLQLETINITEEDASFKVFRNTENGVKSYWHYHPEIELVFIEKGSGISFIGDAIVPYSVNELILIGENLPHNFVSSNPINLQDEKAIIVQFKKDLFSGFKECINIDLLIKKASCGLLFKQVNEDLQNMISSLADASPLKRLSTIILVLEIMANQDDIEKLSSVTFARKISIGKQQKRINEVTSFIIENHHRGLRLEEVAMIIGMTPPSFSRWFKQSVGNSFVAYLNALRIEKACQYLITTDWPVKLIIFKSGFESVSNFNRTFKRLKGATANAYRSNRTSK